MTEKKLSPSQQVQQILIACSKAGARMFRMQVGLAWIGSKIKKIERPGRYVLDLPAGAVVVYDARPLKSGTVGMSDTGGWVTIKITEDMVGTKIAQSAWIEVKQGAGRLSKEQAAFIQAARLAGCRAGVARTVEEAVGILKDRY